MTSIRPASFPDDSPVVGELWTAHLGWAMEEVHSRWGFRLYPVDEQVADDLTHPEQFSPPSGRLVLAFDADADAAVGTAALRRIGPGIAEIKRMYVSPEARRTGAGRAMVADLVEYARGAGYERIRLDSTSFMHAAHALYRSFGFVEIEPYPESEIPDEFKPHWLFMELVL